MAMTRRYHAARLTRPYLQFIAASAAFMAAVLLLDGPGLPRQLSLSAATFAFLVFFVRRLGIDSRQVICAIVVATLGEVVLSLGWGLYSYAHALIPLYVPPGHGLFYTLAAASARQPLFQAHERAITRAVLIFGTIYAVMSLIAFGDAWGLLWWLGALALIGRSRNQLLLAACFAFTILLEWAGTANGNWLWAPEVPGVGLHSANPPAGVGILYILLDLIVVAITSSSLLRWPSSRSLWPARLWQSTTPSSPDPR
jgi:hypothetical protein